MFEKLIRHLLEKAEVEVNGHNPGDIQVHNPNFYRRVALRGSVGLGESYMEGWWDSERVDLFVERLLSANIKTMPSTTAIKHFLNFQRWRPFHIGKAHYDHGNEFYEKMLDSEMSYTAGHWDKAENLDQAQENKLELICQKLGLEDGMKILDIGCGFGAFARHATRNYGAQVTGITVSVEQAKLAREKSKDLPIDIQVVDYMDAKGEYDAIVSIEMIEAVGLRNFRKYFEKAHSMLNPCGNFLLQAITTNQSTWSSDAWLDKYIFPDGKLGSISQIVKATEGNFVVEEVDTFSPHHYPRTLQAWNTNLFGDDIPSSSDNRMWHYYLMICDATFTTEKNQVSQINLRRPSYNI